MEKRKELELKPEITGLELPSFQNEKKTIMKKCQYCIYSTAKGNCPFECNSFEREEACREAIKTMSNFLNINN